MKTLFKIAEALFVVLTISYFVYIIWFKPKEKPVPKPGAAAVIIANPSVPVIKRFKDAVGENHTQIAANANRITKATLSDTTLIRKSMLDTIMKRVSIKNAKDILEITRLNELLQLENEKLRADTGLKGRSVLYYRDKWLYARVNTNDSTFSLTYNASLTATKFTRWKLLPFPFRQTVYDFYGDDPRLSILGVKHLLVEQASPFFGLKVQARTSFDISSGSLIPSAGVELKLGPVDLGGHYYYSAVHERWQPMVSGTLNLLQIK